MEGVGLLLLDLHTAEKKLVALLLEIEATCPLSCYVYPFLRLPVKTSGKARFYGEKLHHVRFYDRRERNYVIYVHIDVNLDGRVGLLLLDLHTAEKKLVALLLEIEATCPLSCYVYPFLRLLVKTSGKARFYGEKLHHVRFYDRRERNYVIYMHIDVNLDGRGGFAAARPSYCRKEIGGALA